MDQETCPWGDLFDDDDKSSLTVGLFLTGFLSVLLGLWLNLSIVLTDLWHDQSYRNLSNFTRTALLRRVVAVIPFVGVLGRSSDSQVYCNVFAFLETFLAVFEVEWLTHVCIERYVVAKYVTNDVIDRVGASTGLTAKAGTKLYSLWSGFSYMIAAPQLSDFSGGVTLVSFMTGWPMMNNHYTLFKCLCVFFAAIYSFLPLFGFGGYGLDFSCTSCTFDMILPDSWQRYSAVTIFFLRSVKPSIVMLTMLVWACILEENLKAVKESQDRRKFTRNIIVIMLVNLFCWTPIALIRGGVVLSQLIYSQPIILSSVHSVKWAMWIQWVAPAMTALTLFIVDKNIRNKMLLISNPDESETIIKEQKNK